MEFPLQDLKLAETKPFSLEVEHFCGSILLRWELLSLLPSSTFMIQGAEALGSCQARRLLISFPCCWELSLQVLEFLFICFQQEMLMVPAV